MYSTVILEPDLFHDIWIDFSLSCLSFHWIYKKHTFLKIFILVSWEPVIGENRIWKVIWHLFINWYFYIIVSQILYHIFKLLNCCFCTWLLWVWSFLHKLIVFECFFIQKKWCWLYHYYMWGKMLWICFLFCLFFRLLAFLIQIFWFFGNWLFFIYFGYLFSHF